MHSVSFSPRAARDLEDCPPDVRRAVGAAIEGLALAPRPPGTRKLSGNAAGAYRVRVGGWRILYDVYDKERAVVIVRIGPRKSVYR